MSDDPFVYPGTLVLRNKRGIRDADMFDYAERVYVTKRSNQRLPTGDFDLKHLRAIHRHLFQDIYEWPGEIRKVEISKGGHQFMLCQFIENGMGDVHRRILEASYFKGTSKGDFAAETGTILGYVNNVHPFREGNGRTQLLYLKQLAANAGYSLDLRKFDPADWIEASKRAHAADYEPMQRALLASLG